MTLLRRTMLPLCALIFLSPLSTTTASPLKPQFVSAEHVILGDKVKIYYSANDPGKEGAVLHLPNGLNLTYGEIVSMGDFYEILSSPVSQVQSDTERKARFLAAFLSFTEEAAVISEVNQILGVVHDEMNILNEGIKKGETTEEIYKKIGNDNERKLNCITGGGCNSLTWFLYPGRYLSLANQGYDHFGDNAWITYKTGHDLALKQATLAHQTNDLKKLEIAYAMDAFASHFLSDRFASGHIRTPHQALLDHVTPGTIGSILAGYMHSEENARSIHVHNERGDHWIAYGDKSYFNPINAQHRNLINETLQASVNQIFAAYQSGSINVDDTVSKLIPQPDETGNHSQQDISPLFYWDNSTSKLMRRSDMTNVNDRHWTSDWWGWSTMIELQKERGLDFVDQAALALSGMHEQALQAGLITNKEIVTYIKQQK